MTLMATIGREITEDAMARRMMIPGTTMKEIAEELGLHYNTIRKYARSERFHDKLAALRRRLDGAVLPDLQERLRQAAARSLQVMNDKLDSKNERVQLRAAIDLMDRDPRLSKTRKVRAVSDRPVITP